MIYIYEIGERYDVHTDKEFAEHVLGLGEAVAILTEQEWAAYNGLARKIDGELFLGKTEQEVFEEKASEVRLIRDDLLAQCDWTLLRAMETGQNVPTEWSEYRQALRDITGQEGFPFNVVFPTSPQSGEFGLLLNETDRAIVTGNIVENAHIMDNDSDYCVIENNISDVL